MGTELDAILNRTRDMMFEDATHDFCFGVVLGFVLILLFAGCSSPVEPGSNPPTQLQCRAFGGQVAECQPDAGAWWYGAPGNVTCQCLSRYSPCLIVTSRTEPQEGVCEP